MIIPISHQLVEIRPAVFILFDPFPGEFSALDLFKDLFHFFAGPLIDDPGAAGQVPVAGGIGNPSAPAADAPLLNKIRDQF